MNTLEKIELSENFIYSLTTKERIMAFRDKQIEMKTDRSFLDKWTNIRGLSNIKDTMQKIDWIRYELTLPKTRPMICGKYTKKYGILF